MVRIEETTDYMPVLELFRRNDLEISDEEMISPNILHCWKAENEENLLIGGCVLARFEEDYIIDGIAVEEPFRKSGVASLLLNEAIKKAKELGTNRLYLVARAPEFFKKHGCVAIEWETSPQFFGCYSCPQRGKKCFPEVMKLEL